MVEPTTSLTRLLEATLSYRPDGQLWGGLLVQGKTGDPKLYAQYLPQHPHFDPPGWSAIADLVGIQAIDVVNGWAEDGSQDNPVAQQAFALLQDYIGIDFIGREGPGVGDEKAIELIPLHLGRTEPELDLGTGSVITPGGTFVPPVAFTKITGVYLQAPSADHPEPRLRFESEDADPGFIQVPDADFRIDPPEWFFVESIAGASGTRISLTWTSPAAGIKQNVHVDQLVARLCQLLIWTEVSPRFAPMTPEGQLDFNALRRALVQELFKKGQRPTLFTDRNTTDVANRAWTLIRDIVGPCFLRYNVERGARSGTPAVVRRVEGQEMLEILGTKEKVRGVLETHIDFMIPKKGRACKVTVPNDPIAQRMIHFADQTVPPIETLVRIPMMRRDGTIHDTPGYDSKSRIWYSPELKLDAIPDSPSASDIRAAVGIISTPFVDFPFVEEAGSRAAALACLFDQIVRPMVNGPRPLYAIDAPALRGQGTGKGMLAKAIGAIITGRDVEITPWPEDPKELSKTLTSKFMAGEPYIIFDNLEGVIKHKDLAAAATTTTWSARLLHSNESPKLPMVSTIVMTLNGAKYSLDIARRTFTVKLDAKVADPHRREGWRLPMLIPWCIQHRAAIIRAVLVLARAWVVAGRPRDKRLVVGSFESWAHVVGGILAHAGIMDLPLALAESHARNVDGHENDEFILRWMERLKSQGDVTALQLALLAEEFGFFKAQLEKVTTNNWKGRHMADILSDMQGQSFGGYTVIRSEQKVAGHFMYRLAPINKGLVQ